MKKSLFIIGLFAYVLTGCAQFDEQIQIPESELTETTPQTRAGTTTYEILPDPYALENMQAVYNSCGVNITLQATDLYVRFRPQDAEQLNSLENTYDLDLFDHSLDIDIPNGEEYVDPTIPEGEPIWYYTTVKPSFIFPSDIPFEVIR